METNIVNELREEAIRRAKQARVGLQNRDAAVLLSLMSEINPEDGEVTSVRTVFEIARELELTENQVQKAMLKLRDLGLIARRQMLRRAGESAFTTILPTAYSALGIHSPTGQVATTDALPRELSDLLCGQSWEVVEAVSVAWHNHEPLPDHLLSGLRGTGFDRLRRMFEARTAEVVEEREAAITAAMELEDLRAAGFDRIQTADGTATVNVKAFEQSCPEATSWSFVKDVLQLMYDRNPQLVTMDNLRDRIAEAAYARAALPFVRDKGWSDAVRLLARQMEVRWDKPRRIWSGWYTTVDRLIHRPAALSH